MPRYEQPASWSPHDPFTFNINITNNNSHSGRSSRAASSRSGSTRGEALPPPPSHHRPGLARIEDEDFDELDDPSPGRRTIGTPPAQFGRRGRGPRSTMSNDGMDRLDEDDRRSVGHRGIRSRPDMPPAGYDGGPADPARRQRYFNSPPPPRQGRRRGPPRRAMNDRIEEDSLAGLDDLLENREPHRGGYAMPHSRPRDSNPPSSWHPGNRARSPPYQSSMGPTRSHHGLHRKPVIQILSFGERRGQPTSPPKSTFLTHIDCTPLHKPPPRKDASGHSAWKGSYSAYARAFFSHPGNNHFYHEKLMEIKTAILTNRVEGESLTIYVSDEQGVFRAVAFAERMAREMREWECVGGVGVNHRDIDTKLAQRETISGLPCVVM